MLFRSPQTLPPFRSVLRESLPPRPRALRRASFLVAMRPPNPADRPPNGNEPPVRASHQALLSKDPRLRSLIFPNETGDTGKPSPVRANQGRELSNQRKKSVANQKLEVSIKNLRKNYERFCKKNQLKLLSVPEGIVEVRRQIRKERGLRPKRDRKSVV